MGSTENILCRIVLFVVLLADFTASQDLLNSQDYIKTKEKQVKAMADEIVRLDGARCDFVANCSSSHCSRHACTAIKEDHDPSKYNFMCEDNDTLNSNCNISGNVCYGRQLNYAMSYIRFPLNITNFSQLSNQMCSTICMTSNFTSTLNDLATMDQYGGQFYFGSIDGVYRIFPGEEANDSDCINYDPRRRVWYNGAISIRTHYIVLIDNSYSARTSQTSSQTLSYVRDASIKIVQQLIYTPLSGDILDVITFDESNATLLNTGPVIITDYIGSGDFNDGRNGLLDHIDNISTGKNLPSPMGFIQAMSIALQSNSYNNAINFTVMLVFTNGDFADNLQSQQIIGMLNNHSIKLFVYSFKDSPILRDLASECGGYYENLTDNFDNPLYQINSFFNFMALARNGSDAGEPYWTKYYDDFGGRGNIITVSYRALSPMGHLVGVTAIDIISESVLQDLPNILQDKLGSRPTNSSALINPALINATKYTCGNCNGSVAVCPKSISTSYVKLECCNSCFLTNNKMDTGKIIAAAVVPAVGVGVLVLVISVAWWLKKRREEINYPPTTEEGPYE